MLNIKDVLDGNLNLEKTENSHVFFVEMNDLVLFENYFFGETIYDDNFDDFVT